MEPSNYLSDIIVKPSHGSLLLNSYKRLYKQDFFYEDFKWCGCYIHYNKVHYYGEQSVDLEQLVYWLEFFYDNRVKKGCRVYYYDKDCDKKLKLLYEPLSDSPPFSIRCLCGQKLRSECHYYYNETGNFVISIGVCCAKYLALKKDVFCFVCETKLKTRRTNYCKDCMIIKKQKKKENKYYENMHSYNANLSFKQGLCYKDLLKEENKSLVKWLRDKNWINEKLMSYLDYFIPRPLLRC